MQIAKGNKAGAVEERIPCQTFHSSDSLKYKIREMIAAYCSKGWDFVHLTNNGKFIILRFKRADSESLNLKGSRNGYCHHR
ncbi:MAG: hypothetical protein ACE5I1_21670 [bacterium]